MNADLQYTGTYERIEDPHQLVKTDIEFLSMAEVLRLEAARVVVDESFSLANNAINYAFGEDATHDLAYRWDAIEDASGNPWADQEKWGW